MENRIVDPVRIGDRLRALRGTRSIAVVSKATGLSQARIGNYEHGIRVPTDEAKVLLANFYCTSVQKIFFT